MNRAQPPQVLAATAGGRSLLFHLDAGEGVPRHGHPGARVVLAVLSGEVHVTTDEGTRTLHGAEVITHDGNEPLALEADQSDTRVLVTLLGGA
ncbi:cupin domain-containing protein [Deinococcus planocerae]|uniref:cupin domain-containing protein n=1 Tax=Deinococcus planocerae TaxID=1737569 RepID=UPI000C7ECABF|nr:cupin domain-containing protein [Deinococcus planocerae]